jgi:hypothetical protein
VALVGGAVRSRALRRPVSWRGPRDGPLPPRGTARRVLWEQTLIPYEIACRGRGTLISSRTCARWSPRQGGRHHESRHRPPRIRSSLIPMCCNNPGVALGRSRGAHRIRPQDLVGMDPRDSSSIPADVDATSPALHGIARHRVGRRIAPRPRRASNCAPRCQQPWKSPVRDHSLACRGPNLWPF